MITKGDNLKKKFLEVYESKACNISATCKSLSIKRQWYYDNIKKDNKFAEECKMIEEGLIDFAESALIKNIKDGKETSLIFFLKCKGKDRGYIEKQAIEQSGDINMNIKVDWMSGD